VRVRASKALRVGPGDEVLFAGALSPGQRLGRLFVFAKEGDVEFSPYVYHAADKMRMAGEDHPRMMTPLTMRLTEKKREDQLTFVADIDGFLCIMQEVDAADDPRAKITLKRKICPYLPWPKKISRRLSGILSWTN
jgi:hypothetical protein